ncbi:conserved hypothetical protein [Xanthomonas citri pv. citri]|nr:conserved hypothetical protein [Xanthomonas citri pv. citri]CEE86628.1 conserved hypothetical protein [Xanthomonas citri pv. citri]CEF47306.1 conserved hypothetical protein [Xanthomonas citri pv. citri]
MTGQAETVVLVGVTQHEDVDIGPAKSIPLQPNPQIRSHITYRSVVSIVRRSADVNVNQDRTDRSIHETNQGHVTAVDREERDVAHSSCASSC